MHTGIHLFKGCKRKEKIEKKKKIFIYSLKGIKEKNKKGGVMIRRTFCSYVYFNTRDEFIARGGSRPLWPCKGGLRFKSKAVLK